MAVGRKRTTPARFGRDLSESLLRMARERRSEVFSDVERAGRDCASDAAAASPRDTGAYASGWRADVERRGDDSVTVRVRNAAAPTLVHLLEFGHEQFYMGRDLGYRQPGRPHLTPAYDEAVEELRRRVSR